MLPWPVLENTFFSSKFKHILIYFWEISWRDLTLTFSFSGPILSMLVVTGRNDLSPSHRMHCLAQAFPAMPGRSIPYHMVMLFVQ